MRQARDHPRACGEHQLDSVFRRVGLGSSPRLRGTPTSSNGIFTGCWIIPALAGNTRRRRCIRPPSWDHPRACGEHDRRADHRHTRQGSSPRLRGTQQILRVVIAQGGIIPALAGNALRNPNNLNISEKKEVCFYSLLFSTMSKRRNTCRNARLLSTVFACTPVFGSVAPPMPLRPRVSLAFLLVWMLDQLQSVAIHWLPIGSEYAKIKVLLVPS